MRNNQPVTQKEYSIPSDYRLISGTDRKGRITYCNDLFAEVSGFSEEELIGQPHNIIRHPDMPTAVFKEMWQTIAAGRVWMGLVKNRCKNGDTYWVSAFVTPVYEDNEIVGYESVRVVASADQKRRAEAAYARIRAGKPARSAGQRWLAACQSVGPVLGPGMLVSGLAFWLFSPAAAGLFLANTALASIWLASKRRSEWQKLLADSPESFTDRTVAETYFDSSGVMAQAQLAQACELARSRTALTRIQDAASALDQIAAQTLEDTDRTFTATENQRDATQQVASAITEMSAAIQEVAGNVEANAESAKSAKANVEKGTELANETKSAIYELDRAVASIATTVREVSDSTNEIDEAAALISTIAEQTNLLALNAAIEAARAGEQGRGFSVVADEVRSLASKTRDSTDKIHDIIEVLAERSLNAVKVSEAGEKAAREGVEIVDKTCDALNSVNSSVSEITDLTVQMSSAVEEQSAVAEHINQQVVDIADDASDTRESASQSQHANQRLSQTVADVRSIIARFMVKKGGG